MKIDKVIAGVEATMGDLLCPKLRQEYRRDEVAKLSLFNSWQLRHRSTLPPGKRVFGFRWVDTPVKSRLTCQDLKCFDGKKDTTGRVIHCPTPHPISHGLFQAIAIHRGHYTTYFDVVSAFPHADETDDEIFMEVPQEFFEAHCLECAVSGLEVPENLHDYVLWMSRTLYGRRNAGAAFRDFFEDCMPKALVRGDSEPCLYSNRLQGDEGVNLLHHIDDGKTSATQDETDKVIAHLAVWMLLKVSAPQTPTLGITHLGSIQIRLESGMVFISDKKHAEAIYAITGVDKNPPTKFVATPSVKRWILTDADIVPIEESKASEYRSAVGSAIYLSLEDEMITFAVKELARHLHEPRECDWSDLIRLAKYLWHHKEDVSVQSIDRGRFRLSMGTAMPIGLERRKI